MNVAFVTDAPVLKVVKGDDGQLGLEAPERMDDTVIAHVDQRSADSALLEAVHRHLERVRAVGHRRGRKRGDHRVQHHARVDAVADRVAVGVGEGRAHAEQALLRVREAVAIRVVGGGKHVRIVRRRALKAAEQRESRDRRCPGHGRAGGARLSHARGGGAPRLAAHDPNAFGVDPPALPKQRFSARAIRASPMK